MTDVDTDNANWRAGVEKALGFDHEISLGKARELIRIKDTLAQPRIYTDNSGVIQRLWLAIDILRDGLAIIHEQGSSHDSHTAKNHILRANAILKGEA